MPRLVPSPDGSHDLLSEPDSLEIKFLREGLVAGICGGAGAFERKISELALLETIRGDYLQRTIRYAEDQAHFLWNPLIP